MLLHVYFAVIFLFTFFPSIFTKVGVIVTLPILYSPLYYMFAKLFSKKMKNIFGYANRLRTGVFILRRKFVYRICFDFYRCLRVVCNGYVKCNETRYVCK